MIPAPNPATAKKAGSSSMGSGYVKNADGKWAWNLAVLPNHSQEKQQLKKHSGLLTRSPSEPTIEFLQAHSAFSSKHPAKDGKVEHSTVARNIVGEEFQSAGKDSGLEIWRIENMRAKPIPKDQYGKFYSGDAYIVLNTILGSSAYHIHYWIGKDSSQDKYATAAYKTVELDNHFTGGGIQHRETQGQESSMFLSYFPDGIKYLEGGVASAFKHVKREEFAKRLLRLKGKRDVRVKLMEISPQSLNKGDVFVLDIGRTVFQWNGPHANRAERVKGVEVVRSIKDNERGGRVQIIVIEYHEDAKLNDNKKLSQFWEALGSQGVIANAEVAGDDVEYEKNADTNVRIHKIKEEANKIEISEMNDRPLKKELLDSHFCYVIDADTEVFCWVGKATTTMQKNSAMEHAKSIHQQKPSWVQLLRVVQGAETPLLKEKFVNWRALVPKNVDYSSSESLLPRANIAQVRHEEVDVASLLVTDNSKVPQPDKGFLHDGTGTLKVWRIDEFRKVEVPEGYHGVFFEDECYICMYMEVKDKKRCHYIYFWQGRHAPMEFKGASALMAKEMADTVRGKCSQFRIAQGKEPEHFLMMFKNKKSAVISDQNKTRDCAYPVVIGTGQHRARDAYAGLYHIKQTFLDEAFEWNTKAVQVPAVISSLNSNDAFVLLGKDGKCFVWCGAGCSAAERRVARAVAQRLVGDANVGRILVFDEGKEPAYFWAYLEGGDDVEKVRGLYPCANYLKRTSLAVRLFVCSNTTGTFKVTEIPNFIQDDLDNDDVFMLDCFAEVFLWVGAGANETEKKLAMQTALEYVAQGVEKVGRPVDTPIYYVQAGAEPPQFTCHFLAWDASLLAPSQNPEINDFIVTKPKPLIGSYKPPSTTAGSTSSSSSSSHATPTSVTTTTTPSTSTTPRAPTFPRTPSSTIPPVSVPASAVPHLTSPRNIPPNSTTTTPSTTSPRSNTTTTSSTPTRTTFPITFPRSATTTTTATTTTVPLTSPRATSPRAYSYPPRATSPTTTTSTPTSHTTPPLTFPRATSPTTIPSHTSTSPTTSPRTTSPRTISPRPTTSSITAPRPTYPITSLRSTSATSIAPTTTTTSSAIDSSFTTTSNTPHATTNAASVAVAGSSDAVVDSKTKDNAAHSEEKARATNKEDGAKHGVEVKHAQDKNVEVKHEDKEVHVDIVNRNEVVRVDIEVAQDSAEHKEVVVKVAHEQEKHTGGGAKQVSDDVKQTNSGEEKTTPKVVLSRLTVEIPSNNNTGDTPKSGGITPGKVILTKKDGSALTIDNSKPKKYVVLAKRFGAAAAAEAKKGAAPMIPGIPTPTKVVVKEVKVELVKNEWEKYNKQFYTFEELSAKRKPPGVDVTALEKYLTDEDFEKVLSMTRVAFNALPSWKKITARKNAKLY